MLHAPAPQPALGLVLCQSGALAPLHCAHVCQELKLLGQQAQLVGRGAPRRQGRATGHPVREVGLVIKHQPQHRALQPGLLHLLGVHVALGCTDARKQVPHEFRLQLHLARQDGVQAVPDVCRLLLLLLLPRLLLLLPRLLLLLPRLLLLLLLPRLLLLLPRLLLLLPRRLLVVARRLLVVARRLLVAWQLNQKRFETRHRLHLRCTVLRGQLITSRLEGVPRLFDAHHRSIQPLSVPQGVQVGGILPQPCAVIADGLLRLRLQLRHGDAAGGVPCLRLGRGMHQPLNGRQAVACVQQQLRQVLLLLCQVLLLLQLHRQVWRQHRHGLLLVLLLLRHLLLVMLPLVLVVLRRLLLLLLRLLLPKVLRQLLPKVLQLCLLPKVVRHLLPQLLLLLP